MSEREQIQIGRDSGRVKVFVRIRPLNREENAAKTQSVLQVSREHSQISLGPGVKAKTDKVFQFDHVFSPDITNQQVCDQLSRPIVNSALNGFNGTLIAYGQTGTGKTHTLMAADGITHDIIRRVFDNIHSDTKHNFKVSASYLQIYQEKIHDLLTNNTRVELSIRENSKSGIYVENLTEYVIRSPAEALSLIAFGKRRLVFAETKMNRTSSRSHSVFQLTINKTPKKERHATDENSCKDLRKVKAKSEISAESVMERMGLDEDVIIKGKIHLCDLAGSERVKKTHAAGERLSEAQHINSSLLELGNVIQALADSRKSHVPFRNSVLTRLLQESLGGNCKTSLIVCVSPTSRDIHETKGTLHFGSRAMRVTNAAFVNMEVDFKRLSESLLKKLEQQEQELTELRRNGGKEWQSEKQLLVEQIEIISAESESVIKSLRTMFEKQTNQLKKTIEDAENEIASKDECIAALKDELANVRKNQIDEQGLKKLLLLNEMTSVDLLAATECGKDFDGKKVEFSTDGESVRKALLEHCLVLLQFFNLSLGQKIPDCSKGSPITQCKCDSSTDSARSGCGSDTAFEVNVKDQEGIGYLKRALLQSKMKMDHALTEVFSGHTSSKSIGINHENGNATSLMDLCQIILEKGDLSRKIAVENQELKMQIASLRKENEANIEEVRTEQVNNKIKSMEIFADKLKRALEVQTDVDEKFSGFEFTLSKIEDILSEKSGHEEKNATDLGSQKLKDSAHDRRGKEVNTKSLKPSSETTSKGGDSRRHQDKLPVFSSRQRKKAVDEPDLDVDKSDGKKKREEYSKTGVLSQYIESRQRENLMQFVGKEDKENKLPHLNFSQSFSLQDDFSDLDSLEENAVLSKFDSDIKEIEDIVKECIGVQGEISQVQAEIERRKKKEFRGNAKNRTATRKALKELDVRSNKKVSDKSKQALNARTPYTHGSAGFVYEESLRKWLPPEVPLPGSVMHPMQHYKDPFAQMHFIKGSYYVPPIVLFPVVFHSPGQPSACCQCKANALGCCQGYTFHDDWNATRPVPPYKQLLSPSIDAANSQYFTSEYPRSNNKLAEFELISAASARTSELSKDPESITDMTPSELDFQAKLDSHESTVDTKDSSLCLAETSFLEDHCASKQQACPATEFGQCEGEGLGNTVKRTDDFSGHAVPLRNENERLKGWYGNENEQLAKTAEDNNGHLRNEQLYNGHLDGGQLPDGHLRGRPLRNGPLRGRPLRGGHLQEEHRDDRQLIAEGSHAVEASSLKEGLRWDDYDRVATEALSVNQSTDNVSLTSDEELDSKIECLLKENGANFVDEHQNEEQGNKSNRKRKRTSFEKLLVQDCGSLEVQISTGSAQNRYGDSFLSPLAKDELDDDDVEDQTSVVTEPDETLHDDVENQQGVVVKKSWSLANWFWWKRGSGYKAPVVPIVIQ